MDELNTVSQNQNFYLEEGYMTHESFNVAHVGKSGKEDMRGSSSIQNSGKVVGHISK